MPTFEELYRSLLLASAQSRSKEELARLAAVNFDRHQMDCLLHPENHPLTQRSAEDVSMPVPDGREIKSRDAVAVLEALLDGGTSEISYGLEAPGDHGTATLPGQGRGAKCPLPPP